MCIRRRKQWRQELLESLESPGHAQDQVHDRLLRAVPLVDSTVVRLFVQKRLLFRFFKALLPELLSFASLVCPMLMILFVALIS